MAIITTYPDDAASSDDDKFLTVDDTGATVLTPASNINKYLGDGWTLSGDSWSFSSYSAPVGVINTNSGATTKYGAGTKVKFDQPTLGTKYGVITSVTTSSITVVLNSGSQLDNEAITNPEFSVAASPHGSGAVLPAQRSGGFKVGSIAGTTFGTTGNKQITGVGFKPKIVRFQGLPTAAGDNALMSTGKMDENGNQYVTAITIGSAGSAIKRNSSESACIGFVPTTSSSFAMLASYVSMDDDGFTINVTTADSGLKVGYEAVA